MKDIDRQVAEKIMGWKASKYPYLSYYDKDGNDIILMEDWQPSTNIAHAFEVIDKLIDMGFYIKIFIIDGGHGVEVSIFKQGVGKKSKHHIENEVYTEYAKTPAMAICGAALSCVEDKNE